MEGSTDFHWHIDDTCHVMHVLKSSSLKDKKRHQRQTVIKFGLDEEIPPLNMHVRFGSKVGKIDPNGTKL